VSKPDLEALVTPRIAEAFQAALDKVGRSEFETITGIDDQHLAAILSAEEAYIAVALVTLACQINKSHADPNPAHTSVTECLKGTTIRMPPTGEQVQPTLNQQPGQGRRIRKIGRETRPSGSLYDRKTARLAGFSANIIFFFALGYFLGGIALSPLLGQQSCTGVSTSPPSLDPCIGSYIGLVLGAFGGLGYTYYFFVKKM